VRAPNCERCGGPCRAAEPAADLVYDATAEWKKRALAAEEKLARVEALANRYDSVGADVTQCGTVAANIRAMLKDTP
jgi:hypothetical protein